MPYKPCANELSAWRAAYAAWQKKYDAAKEGIEDYAMAAATALTVCGGALLMTTAVIGGIFGGAACAIAVWRAWDKFDDGRKLINEAHAANDASVAAGNAYKACVNKHKLAEAIARQMPEVEVIHELEAGVVPRAP
jgi:hypothetical protein